MSNRLADSLAQRLTALDQAGLRRRRRTLERPCGPLAQVAGRELVAFAANDYLGLANHPALVAVAREAATQWGVGSGASHLVSGHLAPFDALEAALARFCGRERALFFGTGYLANLGILTALVGRGDHIFADRLNHASLIDAAQLSRANHHRYPHGNLAVLADQLQRCPPRGDKLIVTDGVFSMDGDQAPLRALYDLAVRYDAWLVVDDAHGFGVLGPQGRGSLALQGLPDDPRIVHMGTLGKAAGVSGAFVAGDGRVVEWIMQTARTGIFTTASSPLVAATLCASLELIAGGDALRATLARHRASLQAGLATTPWTLLPSDSAIQVLVVGDNHLAVALSQRLEERGYWVPAIRPPTVPPGTARLRISLSAAHTEAQVAGLAGALQALAGESR